MVRILVNNGIPLEYSPAVDKSALKESLASSGISPKMASSIVRIVDAGTMLSVDWQFLEEYDRGLLHSTLHKLTMLKSETVSDVLDLLYEAAAPPASDSIPTLRFVLSDGELNVFGTDIEDVNIEVPSQIRVAGGLHDVKAVGPRAFWGSTVISNINLPDTVTYIHRNAFWGCTSIMFLKLPDSVEFIGPDAFSRCSALTSLDLPSCLKTISSGAFSSCAGIRRITIPDSVTVIGDGAFKHCTNLESVVFPESDIELGKDVFEGCPFLDEATKARIAQLTGE
jgi:hypothetical protein